MSVPQQSEPGRIRGGECGPDFFAGGRRRARKHQRGRNACAVALAVLAVTTALPLEMRAGRSACATEEQSTQTPTTATNSKTTSGQTSSTKKKKKGAAARRPLAPEPERIREIQQALAREGFYHGEPTGKWDEASVAAMKDFQAAKGLPATGKLEALSLQKLGLGSPVAGVAPPEPRPGAAQTAPAKDKPPN